MLKLNLIIMRRVTYGPDDLRYIYGKELTDVPIALRGEDAKNLPTDICLRDLHRLNRALAQGDIEADVRESAARNGWSLIQALDEYERRTGRRVIPA